MENVKSASHQVVPEIEHLLEDTFPTDIHDMGSHTVSVTHLDLEKKVRKNSNGETERNKVIFRGFLSW